MDQYNLEDYIVGTISTSVDKWIERWEKSLHGGESFDPSQFCVYFQPGDTRTKEALLEQYPDMIFED